VAILFSSKWDSYTDWATEIHKLKPDLQVFEYPDAGSTEAIEMALIWDPPEDGFAAYPNLKAIMLTGAGVEHILGHPDLPAGIPIARNVDPGLAATMTDYITAAVLRYHRQLDLYERRSREGNWDYHKPPRVEDCRVGIMGLGALGSHAARHLADLGFNVAGWSRSKKEIDSVECFHGRSELTSFLNRTDILVCLLPSTSATAGIINAETLAALPKGAHIVNVARGAHIVDDDLLAALASEHIAGATLDVFDEEPLPSEHRFWRHENILITPHIAAIGSARTSAPQVVENLRRARAGEPLLNQVDVAAGY
jgi:glyoxylate/hydroxypyruvate reductase A